MNWGRTSLAAILSFLVAGVAYATDPPYGYGSETDANIEAYIWVVIDGVGADHDVISGTNIMLNLSAGARENVDWTGSPVWEDCKFFHAVLTIGGIEVYDREYEFTIGGGGAGFSSFGGGVGGNEYNQDAQPPDVRFASNKFAAAGTSPLYAPLPIDVPIVLTADFALIKNGAWDEDDTITVTVTITPTAKNRFAMWKSYYDSTGTPWAGADGGRINDLINNAREAFKDAKYGFDSEIQDQKAAALSDIGASTSLFAVAHGSATELGDNLATAGNSPTHWMNWTEIGSAVGTARYQWAILYACETGISASAIMAALNMPAFDSAYFGYSVSLTTKASKNSTPTTVTGFGLQADYLFDRLVEGYTGKKARDKTNDDSNGYRCWDLADNPISMTMAGDELTTWTSVYLYVTGPKNRTSLEDSLGRFTDWFVIFE